MYYNHLRNDLRSPVEEQEKNNYFDFLAESAVALLRGGKLYGYSIDVTNPRDVVAALYAMYLNVDAFAKTSQRELDV